MKIGKKSIFILLFYYIFSYILVYTFNFPRILLYIGDGLNFIIFILALLNNKNTSKIKIIYVWMILFTILGIFSSILNFENIILLIWGIKNNVRFFTFFYSATTFFEISDIEKIKKAIKIIFFISIPLCTIERFFVNYPNGTIIGDMVGGIFWNYSGCNTPLNIIISLFLLDTTNQYYNGKTSTSSFIIICSLSFYMAALAELKIFLVEFAVIILMMTLLNRISIKIAFKLLFIFVIFSSFVTYFIYLNQTSDDYADNYTLEGFIEYATRDSGYTGENDLNRLTGISTVSKKIFKDNYIIKSIGIGIGNAEYTNFFGSAFFYRYENTNYQWFHDIWLFIETGYIGLILFILIFITSFKSSNIYLKNTEYCNYVKVAIVLMGILFFYNISLRSETSGFLLYLILAIPYIYQKKLFKENEEEN